jgi:hypothetical protein
MKTKTKGLIFIFAVAIVVLAPSSGRYYENSVVVPKLTLSPTFGIGVQTGATVTGVPWHGANGITETVDKIMERERKHPTHWDGNVRTPKDEEDEELPQLQQNPDAPEIPSWPYDANSKNNGVPEGNAPQTVGVSFDGTQIGETIGYVPPDCCGSVGPTQIVVTSNGRLKVYDKTGVLGALNTTTDNFFVSVRSASTSDTHVRYDRLTQRWFLTVIDVATPDRVLIAVSSGSTITGAASFTFFFFQHDLVGTTPNSDTGGFADYDTLGLDRYALYIGVNIFNAAGTSFLGTTGFVVNKANLISGTLTVTAFRQMGTSSTGIYTPQGVDNDNPNSTEGYFIGTDVGVYSKVNIIRISNPGVTPTSSGNISITTPTTYAPLNQSALGSTRTLDALDHRLFAAQLKTNTITGASSLWTAQNLRVNTSGVGGSAGTRNAARWYEFTNMTSTPTLNQSGTLFDNTASNPRGFWIPSVAMSGQGHMALSCSSAGTNFRADIYISGRLSGDAAGTLEAYAPAVTSSTSYNAQSVTPQRWGDYSQVAVDPTDNMTMWTFQEYCNTANSWCVHVLQLKAPPPATPVSATNVVNNQSSLNTTVTGSSVSGSGFYDPGSDAGGPGYTKHISASVTGGIVVNSVTFLSGTSVQLSLNTTGVSPGTYSVTITNPDGQFLTGTNILTVDNSLPVTMQSFNASVYAANSVALNWATTMELNNSGFDVERSPKNSNSWSSLAFVPGHGTSSQMNHYSFNDEKLGAGKYDYRLKQIDYNGNFEYFTLSSDVVIGAPNVFSVSQSYPNPSNPKARIDYQIPFTGIVNIKIYNLAGQEVTTLVNETKDAGYYTAEFDGTNLASGIYIYRITAKDASSSQSFTKTMKMVLVK